MSDTKNPADLTQAAALHPNETQRGDRVPGTLTADGPERIDFEAIMTWPEVHAIEARESDAGCWAVIRGLTLASLTCDSDALRTALREVKDEGGHPLAGFIALHLLTEWRSHLRECVRLADAAEARLAAVVGGLTERERREAH